MEITPMFREIFGMKTLDNKIWFTDYENHALKSGCKQIWCQQHIANVNKNRERMCFITHTLYNNYIF